MLWWLDYAVLLEKAGLLKQIRKGKAPGTYAFGIHEKTPACFRLLQVPLWDAYTDKKSHLLVFDDITIVDNFVGLLDGKMDLSTLKMRSELANGKDNSKFWLLGRRVVVQNAGSHFSIQLEKPRPFFHYELEFALRRVGDGSLESFPVAAKQHHALSLTFDENVALPREDEHPESVGINGIVAEEIRFASNPLLLYKCQICPRALK
jgi:hypothetical protein